MEQADELARIAAEVSEKYGYWFDDDEIEWVLRFTERKIEINGKGDDYLPILFENELRDYIARAAINVRGLMNLAKKGRTDGSDCFAGFAGACI